MNETIKIFIIVIVATIALASGSLLAYFIYKMTIIDAKARGLKHPKFWGIFNIAGNNSSNILLYLIGRRKFPKDKLTSYDQLLMKQYKRETSISLICHLCGTIILLICIVYFYA
ncbi:hypothetical protein ACQV2R_00655 [Facklamia sp. P12937]|uniref:hypothetical protein n=1 Tax=Facklamia sp. P12937 TaxID=3421949 RepID=UPI003D16DB27